MRGKKNHKARKVLCDLREEKLTTGKSVSCGACNSRL
jgi:hypothetical protein